MNEISLNLNSLGFVERLKNCFIMQFIVRNHQSQEDYTLTINSVNKIKILKDKFVVK